MKQPRPASDAEIKAGMLYCEPGRERPEGWLLAHNSVTHTRGTRQGTRGFRYFWIDPAMASAEGWTVCNCPWRTDLGTHYEHAGRQVIEC